MKHFPKKYLGQHFLRSDPALKAIADAGEVGRQDVVLEIGPGEGALTLKLLQKAGKVFAVEKDIQLVAMLQEKFSTEINNGELEVLHTDIRNFDPAKEFTDKEYKLIANIPYYITGEILRMFLETKKQPEKMVLLIQKEVAQRIMARDGKESILSISIKAYGTPKIIKTVKAGSFHPAPKVDSAILAIEKISKDKFHAAGVSEKSFFEVVKKGFSSKRKKLSSNMDVGKEKWTEIAGKLKIREDIRAENVSLEEWFEITSLILKA